MWSLFLIILSVARASVSVEVQSVMSYGYHERIGIPTATRIKASEDAYFANRGPTARIVGGAVSQSNSHPYLGGLIVSYVNHAGLGVCGSTLISPRRLVTAALCWFDGRLQTNRFIVVLGSDFLFSGGERMATSTIALHPRWHPNSPQNNIAVIYLENPVSLTSNIQLIALPERDERFDENMAIAVGYGKTSDEVGMSLFTPVNEVNLQLITTEECQSVFGSIVQDDIICTSGLHGVGICGGDMGGPLLVNRTGSRVLIGISSFVADDGCELGFPSGFSRVTSFYDFLSLHLW